MTPYPLAWPPNWPRTPAGQRKAGRFKDIGFDRVRRQLFAELERLGARKIVLSTNLPLRQDGMPRADSARARISDPGVALYFEFKGRPTVMARDVYWSIAENARSLTLAIEALRQLDRHGGGTMLERAFTGFAQIEAPVSCWQKLGISPTTSPAAIRKAWLDKVKALDPGASGYDTAMSDLNAARDTAMESCL